jgi:membrane-bound serine protease (ClpP class)
LALLLRRRFAIIVDDAIQPVTAEYIGRALESGGEESRSGGSDRDQHSRRASRFHPRDYREDRRLAVPVIIYVTPSGSRAASAGILHSRIGRRCCHGSGNQYWRGPSRDPRRRSPMDDVMKMKMENDAAALMRSVVAKRGRNVELAESAVRESKSFTEQEALDKKLIEYIAPNEQDLFHQLDRQELQAFRRHNRHPQPRKRTRCAIYR